MRRPGAEAVREVESWGGCIHAQDFATVATLLITGGAGFLGRELVRRAAERGWEVRATWWSSRPELAADWRHADVRDATAMTESMQGVDAVIHTAYRQGDDDEWSTNVDGSECVARASAGLRLIHLSSDVVFDGRRGGYREEDATRAVNSYGRSKEEAERRVAAAHPAATIARTSLLYGGPDPGPQERLAREGSTFYVDEIRSPVRVGELAGALLELLALEVAGPLHLGGEDDVSRFDFAVALGADPARIERAQTTPERAPDVSLDSSRARALLRTRLHGVYDSSAAVRSAR
jgi:dTDP-4-dehydrorhamnose reductase